MKILIVTQKVDKNDAVLGFFHDWIMEFSKNFDKVAVICLELGEYEFPKNVAVFSLGKEKLVAKSRESGIIRKFVYLHRFLRLIWINRRDYDFVFVHMIPLYAILGAVPWKIMHKRISLWYAHGHVSSALRLSEKLVDIIFSSTTEGCRLSSRKIKIIGQGIDTEKFRKKDFPESSRQGIFKIISVGRIAPIKDYETLLKALELLVKKYNVKNIKAKIVGGALLDEHEQYFRRLKRLSHDLDIEKYLDFTGSIPYTNIVQHINESDIMASTSQTGSLDKVMLEAMSMEKPVITCNEAMQAMILRQEKILMYEPKDFSRLAELIFGLISMEKTKRDELGKMLRERVAKYHSLDNLIKKIKECAA